MIDFSLSDELVELRDRVQAFITKVAIPAEARDYGAHGIDPELRHELQQQAREAEVFAPYVPTELGGLGLERRPIAVVFEEAGYSRLAPRRCSPHPPSESTAVGRSPAASGFITGGTGPRSRSAWRSRPRA